VAVLGFKNLSRRPEAEWLSTALSEMLGSELGAGERLRTVPGENVARVKSELSIGDVDSLATDTLGRVRTLLGSDYLVLGSFTSLAGQIRLDLRLQDAAAGETVATLTETGTEGELFQLVARTGARLREKLGVTALGPDQALGARASLPANAEAARLYAEGLGRLRMFDALGARERLERALASDPTHALTHAALAEAWTELGYDGRAREAARQAFERSKALGREERLLVEARYRETTKEWDKAIDIYRALTRFFPDDLEYGLRLAAALEEGGRGRDGLAALAALRALPPPAGRDPRIDITESKLARSVAEHRRAADAAARAAAAAGAQGGRHLMAEARFQQGSALQNLGELDSAKTALEEAERMFAEKGDLRGRAGALNNLALVYVSRGDVARGAALFAEARELYDRIGNLSGAALMQGNLGAVRYMQGQVPQALAMWEQTLVSYRTLNDKQGAARMLTNLAAGLADTGRLPAARRRFEEALTAWRELGNKGGEAVTRGDLGRLLLRQGELAAAAATYDEGIALAREIGEKAQLATLLGGGAEVLAARGDAAGARRLQREALGLQEELGLKPDAALTRLALADLDLREGRAAEAEAAARAVIADAETAKSPAGPPTARLALARALAAQGRGAEARQAAEEARALASRAESAALRVAVEVGAATVEGTSDASAAAPAAARLERLHGEAARLGHVPLQLEARLGLAQVQRHLGEAGAAPRLRGLAAEARALGFQHLAAAAAEAAGAR
jgi:tetratricopeptide (TPR) repeat protein